MIEEGVDLIDIGGESTRPGHQKISEQEEISRVIPIIDFLVKEKIPVPISIDTYKTEVAKAALDAGAHLVNDIWGLQWDLTMAQVIKDYQASICIMHNRKEIDYNQFMIDVQKDIEKSLQIAFEAGISNDKIMIDPGIGFAKTYEQNLIIMNQLLTLHQWGLPVLLGASRKSVIGLTLDLPVDEREEGTMATTAIACMKGCQFVRVHDVKKNKQLNQMLEKIRSVRGE